MSSTLKGFGVFYERDAQEAVVGAVVEVRDVTDPAAVVRILPDLVADGDGVVADAVLGVGAGSKIRLSWKDAASGVCGHTEGVTNAGFTMDLVARASGGHNIVGRPQARPTWQPPAAAKAAHVVVWRRDLDKPLYTAVRIGEYLPGSDFVHTFKPGETRKIELLLVSYSAAGVPSVTNLRDAVRVSLAYHVTMASVGGIDAHVPAVTAAPTIAKSTAGSFWVVLTPMPDSFAATLAAGEVWVEKASDAALFFKWPCGPEAAHLIDQTTYDAKIRYRWRNQSVETLTGDAEDRGWSVWSPYASAAGSDNPVQPPPASGAGGALGGFTADPHDSRAGIETGVIAE